MDLHRLSTNNNVDRAIEGVMTCMKVVEAGKLKCYKACYSNGLNVISSKRCIRRNKWLRKVISDSAGRMGTDVL